MKQPTFENRNPLSTETRAWDYAIYIITRHPLSRLGELCQCLQADGLRFKIFISEKILAKAAKEIQDSHFLSHVEKMPLPMGETIQKNFPIFYCHIFFVSVGAVIRMIRSHIHDKRSDPAVLAIDDQCKFCISLLSGHIGRGNAYTEHIAGILKATPVITTASEVGGTLPVDILGRELGWTLYDTVHNVTATAAAIVNHFPVAFVQDSGEPSFWPKPLPKNVHYFSDFESVDPKKFDAILIASDRQIDKLYPHIYTNGVLYQTKTLILGIGCDKNTPLQIIEEGVLYFLDAHKFLKGSIRAICSIDLKAKEPALLELAEKWCLPYHTYSAHVLDKTEGIQNPSEIVRKYTGSRSVAEAACLQFAYEFVPLDSDLQMHPSRERNDSQPLQKKEGNHGNHNQGTISRPDLPDSLQPTLYPKRKYSEKKSAYSMTCAAARLHYPTRSEAE